MKFRMPNMEYEECKTAIERHIPQLEKMCPESKGLLMGKKVILQGDVVHLEVESYFFATFIPCHGTMIITAEKKTEDTLAKFFRHIFTCKE